MLSLSSPEYVRILLTSAATKIEHPIIHLKQRQLDLEHQRCILIGHIPKHSEKTVFRMMLIMSHWNQVRKKYPC